jgi:3-oxoacyl-[acyl-carrier protein] reductase
MNKKTVLITGASRGIGKEIAIKFAKENYNVIINCSKSFNELMEVTDDIKALGATCLPVMADVSDYQNVTRMIDEILLVFPTIDVIVNNAGISYVGLFTDLTPDMWDNLIRTNLTSVYNVCHQIVPLMLKNKAGTIINISSIWGINGASCEVAYSASKGGINAFTKALAKELGPSNIRVNAIACGAIETTMNTWLNEEEKKAFEDGIALCRFGKASEVANLAYFLATEASSYLTGEVLKLDGGCL